MGVSTVGDQFFRELGNGIAVLAQFARLAYENENFNSAPTESLPEKRDPLDVDPAYKEIMESISELAIDAAIRETNERFP